MSWENGHLVVPAMGHAVALVGLQLALVGARNVDHLAAGVRLGLGEDLLGAVKKTRAARWHRRTQCPRRVRRRPCDSHER